MSVQEKLTEEAMKTVKPTFDAVITYVLMAAQARDIDSRNVEKTMMEHAHRELDNGLIKLHAAIEHARRVLREENQKPFKA